MVYPVINGGTINVDSLVSDSSLISTDGNGNLNAKSLLLSNNEALQYNVSTGMLYFGSSILGTLSSNALPTSDPSNKGQWWNKDGYIVISGYASSNTFADVLIYNESSQNLFLDCSNFIFSSSLPTSDPQVSGQLWNNGGIIGISNGSGTIPTDTSSVVDYIEYSPLTNTITLSSYNTVFINSTLPTTDPQVNGQLWNNGGILSISVSSTQNTVVKQGSDAPSFTVDSATSTKLIISGSSIYFGTLSETDPDINGQLWNNGGAVAISIDEQVVPYDSVIVYNSGSKSLYFKTSNFMFSSSLPTSDPGVNGQLWNNGGIIGISNGSGTIPTNRISIINSINYDEYTQLIDFSTFDTVYIDSSLPTSDPGIDGQLWNNGGILGISVSTTSNTVVNSGDNSSSITTDASTLSSLILTADSIFFKDLPIKDLEINGRIWDNGGTVAISIESATKRTKKKMTISTNNQSTFTFKYDYIDNLDIFLNGLLLDQETAYTATDNNTITLSTDISSSLTTSDILYFILY